MTERIFSLLLCVGIVFVLRLAEAQDFSRGFGSQIAWKKSLSEGFKNAQESNKTLMLLIHKSWCSDCQDLKSEMVGSNEIKELSKNFVMVNSEDDNEVNLKKYSPDGVYWPRILFFSPSGTLLPIINSGRLEDKFTYETAKEVIKAMKQAGQHRN